MSHQDRRDPLPKGYQFGDARLTYCYAANCMDLIAGEVVWLGETYDGVEYEFPFHPRCADGPWPLYEVRRSQAIGWNDLERGEH